MTRKPLISVAIATAAVLLATGLLVGTDWAAGPKKDKKISLVGKDLSAWRSPFAPTEPTLLRT